MKCDTIARALLAAYDEIDFRVPLVVRLEGTNVEKGTATHQGERPQDHHRRRPHRRGPEGRRRGQGSGLTDSGDDVFTRGIMETETMGRVTVEAKIENIGDLFMADNGLLPPDQVRCIEVGDALVDTGATGLSMPKSLIEKLGLKLFRARPALTSVGTVTVQVYGTARLTIQGRDCPTDVTEVAEECPVLIGQIPLEAMDFVVDLKNRRVIGNPAHGGEHMIELY